MFRYPLRPQSSSYRLTWVLKMNSGSLQELSHLSRLSNAILTLNKTKAYNTDVWESTKNHKQVLTLIFLNFMCIGVLPECVYV